jgi:hypothetical protein
MKRVIEFLIFLMAPAFVVAQTPPPFKVYNDLWAMSDIYWKKHDKATSTPPDSVLVVKANLVYVYTGGVAAPSDTLDWLASTYYVDHSLSLIDTSLWARLFGHLYPKIVTDSVIIGANEVPKSLFEVKDLLQFYNLTNSIYAGPLCPFGAPGSDNVALGGGSLNYLATGTGSYNTSVGCNSLGSVIDGEHNTAYGQGAGLNFEGSHSTFIGDRAGMQVYHGDYMTIVGAQAGQGATGADSSIMLGHQAGSYETENGRLYIDNAARDVTGHDSLSRNNARKTALVYGVMDKYPANQMLRVNGHLELPYENTMNSDTFLVIKPTTGEIGYDITAGLAWSDTTGRPGLATRYDLDTLSVCPWSLDGTQVTTQYPVLVPNMLRVGDTTTDHLKVEGSNVFLGREDTSASIAYVYNAVDDRKELTIGTGTAVWSVSETVGGTNTLVTATADTFDLKAYLKPTLDTLTSDTSWVVCPTTRKTGWRIIPGGGLAWSDTATSPGLATAYDLTQISTLSAIPMNKIIFVDALNGNDTTGTRGDASKPFMSLDSASTVHQDGDLIFVLPGTYYPDTTSLTGGWDMSKKGGTSGETEADLLVNPVYYFCPGARVLKGECNNNYTSDLNTDNGAICSAKKYPIRIYGHGTFIRTASDGPTGNGQVFTVGSATYASRYPLYVEADTIICTTGDPAIHGGAPYTPNSNEESTFKVRYCLQNGTYASGFYGRAAVRWASGRVRLDGTYQSNAESTIWQYFNVEGSVVTATGKYINSVSGKACLEIRNGQLNFDGDLGGTSTYGIHLGAIGGTASGGAYADIHVRQYPQATTYLKPVYNNGGNCFVRLSMPYITGTGGTHIIFNAAGRMTIEELATKGVNYELWCDGGTLTCNADFYAYGETSTRLGVGCRGGTTVLNGDIHDLGAPIFIKSGAVLKINGTITYKRSINWGGPNTNSVSSDYYYARGMIIFLGSSPGTLEIGANAKILDETSTNLTSVIFSEQSKGAKIITRGGVIKSTNNHKSILFSGLNTLGVPSLYGGPFDTLSLNVYHYGDLFVNEGYAMQPACVGTTERAGYDFAANPKSIYISLNGGTVDTISITSTCATAQAICDTITEILADSGFTAMECTRTGNYIMLSIQLDSLNNQSNYFELTGGDALTVLGWRQKEYKATVYDMITGGAAIKVDADVE